MREIKRAITMLAIAALPTGCLRTGFHAARDASSSERIDERAAADRSGPGEPDGRLELGSPWPGFSITAFKAQWASSHAVNWIWQCSGAVPDFASLSLCFASDVALLLDGKGSCLGAADSFGLLQLECQGDPWWVLTTTYGLEPGATYHAQIVFADKAGRAARSAPASKSTPPVPSTRLVAFADALPAGAALEGASVSTVKPQAGSAGLLAEHSDIVWHGVKISGLALALSSLDEARRSAGYLELYLDAPRAVGVAVGLGGPAGLFELNKPNGYASPDGKPGYQRIQVPLRLLYLKESSQPATVDQLKASTELHVGAIWGPGPVYLDEIAIVY